MSQCNILPEPGSGMVLGEENPVVQLRELMEII